MKAVQAYPAARREEAESLYLDQGLSSGEIADRLDVAESTVSAWANHDGWEQKRQAEERRGRELDDLLQRLKLRLARQAMSDEDGDDPVSPQQLGALCKVVACSAHPHPWSCGVWRWKRLPRS